METLHLIFHAEKIYLPKDKQGAHHLPKTCPFSNELISQQFKIESHREKNYIASLLTEGLTPTLFEAEFIPLKQSFDRVCPSLFRQIVKAFQLLQWDKMNQYCSQCGQALKILKQYFEKQCLSCQLTTYPPISPSIIVRVQKERQILMARSPHFPSGIYGLIAGFVETGETLEEAVHREVLEEVGIKIKNLKYFGSQPWPFPHSLMLGFTAEYLSGEIQLLDGELDSANWYTMDSLPGLPSSKISIASQMIEDFATLQF